MKLDIKELEKQLVEAEKLAIKQEDELDPEMDMWEWSVERDKLYAPVKKLEQQISLIKEPTMTELPKYGTLMPMENFIDGCESGGFSDYDGFGLYATETQRSNLSVKRSYVLEKKLRTDFTHVLWFSK